ncbi:hypothetical protein BYT27DRAFT_7343194 [Phlegmacium glaucopus]|nr:hypothetical protein BYT27DRAFT_7343194 [Phlegmacium glaucopus]
MTNPSSIFSISQHPYGFAPATTDPILVPTISAAPVIYNFPPFSSLFNPPTPTTSESTALPTIPSTSTTLPAIPAYSNLVPQPAVLLCAPLELLSTLLPATSATILSVPTITTSTLPSSPVCPTPPNFSTLPSAQLYQLDGPTHADRILTTFVQPTKKNKSYSDAQRASQKLRRAADEAAQQTLVNEFDFLLNRHHKEYEELATRHGKKVEYLDKLRGSSKHYRARKGVSIENAKIHAKSIEVNSDRALGDRVKLPELRMMVKDDPTYQNLSKEEEEELRNEVLAIREQKKLGARPSNRSAAQDYRCQVDSINKDITALSERTGAAAICFFTRSHLEDTYEPNWVCTLNAMNFAQDSLGHNMWEITRLFEQWACSKGKVHNPDTLSAMKQECSATINGGLKTAVKSQQAIMNYINYDVQVVQRLKVKLMGWTFHMFVSPQDINAVDDLRTLRDALRCGSCFWMRMSNPEVTRHAAHMLEREEAGEIIGKKRKARSDKGVLKGPKKKPGVIELDDEEEAAPVKKRKTVATAKEKRVAKGKATAKGKGKATPKGRGKGHASSQMPPTSKEFVDSDSEDST